jgi:hypothetical protein
MGLRVKYQLFLRTVLFWSITQRRVVILYRRFGTTYRFHLQGPRSPRRVAYNAASCQILINLGLFSRQILKKDSNFIRFHENQSSGSQVVPCWRTDRRTDMKKLVVAFCNFANAPRSRSWWNSPIKCELCWTSRGYNQAACNDLYVDETPCSTV